ncbi:hypothetical protein [Pseudomonas japonica]|uniref:hypothetical protein n=1 Tax=Pseudomonas japonica TaxID=256466 RepID=UPI0015E390C3|nr:hypothetical protein [Pseudomonas japonica]MBA1245575.1 hypothetical protein [Pseudomonas japonica]
MIDNSNEVINAVKESKKGWRTLVDLAAIGTVLLLISSWVFSLNGRSYHDGYLSYLNQETTMYPVASSDAGFYGTIAWFKLTIGILNTLSKSSIKVFIITLLLILLGVIVYTVFHHYASAKIPTNRVGKKVLINRSPLFRASIINSFSVILALYAALGMLIFTILSIMLMINPFRDVGKDAARKDVEDGYLNAPWLMLRTPSGESPERWKVVECSTQFCILYKDSTVISVPVGKLEWVEALPPGIKKQKL